MELAEYILRNMTDRLLIRLNLNRSSLYGAGMEAVRASLVTCEQRESVMLHATFECHAGSGMGSLAILPRLDKDEFDEMAGGIALGWDGQHHWDELREAVCVFVPPRPRTQLRQPALRYKLDVSHALVLQHLSRIMGALSSAPLHESSIEEVERVDYAVATMANRLQGIISEGNRKLEELGRLTGLS
jgi:hypothetical protein